MGNLVPDSRWRRNIAVLLSVLFAAGMLLYVRRVLVPYQRADAAAHDHPRGNLSDLYPRWLGARELLLHGRDPYGPDITREIQMGYYGRVIHPSRPGDPRDQQAFAYPVYIVFPLAVLIYLPFEIIRVAFYGFLIAVVAATLLLWLRALPWRPRKSSTVILLLLLLGNLPVIQAIELQQLTLVVGLLLAICAVLLARGDFGLAGIALATATIKPQLTIPLAAWLTLWALSRWGQRKNFVWGFYPTLGILFLAGEWILPGWVSKFLHAVAAYQQYTQASSVLDHLSNAQWGPILSAAVLVIVVILCWHFRREPEKSAAFMAIFSLVIAATLVTEPSVSTYNQALLLPAALIVLKSAASLWNRNLPARLIWLLAAGVLVWPWISAFVLAVASFVLSAARVQAAWKLPFYTSLAIPFAVLGLLFQYIFRIIATEPVAELD